jgi:hypothetical protein
VQLNSRFQTLTGFGATLAYAETEVVNHPKRADLYDAMFGALGLDVLRLRNHYGYPGEDDLTAPSAIVAAAEARLGRKPTVFLASWSPPPALKASGTTTCSGNTDTCTLGRNGTGNFDYAGYAAYWRSSLEAYANVGLLADYIAIQNNPDFVPTAVAPGEGCRLLPTEGSTTVMLDGSESTIQLPGFVEAQNAVFAQLAGLSPAPRFIAPDVADYGNVARYLRYLDASKVDAIGHHLYGADPAAIDVSALSQLEQLGRTFGRPLFQTEMPSEGIATAVLVHHAVTVENASAYLHSALVGPPPDSSVPSTALIRIGSNDITLTTGYQALRHFARFTDPGWTRVATELSEVKPSGLLTSAWLSPEGTALTVVLVNPGTSAVDLQLELGLPQIQASSVFRTAFDGQERFANLGALSTEGDLRLPGHSVVTVAVRAQ